LPALVPITIEAPWVSELRGVTLPDVNVRILEGDRALTQRRGSLLFAHFGLSGPVILDVSRVVSGHSAPQNLQLEIDLLPGIKEPELDESRRLETAASGKKQLAVLLGQLVPRRLAEAVLEQAGLPRERKAAALPRLERTRIVEGLKHLRLPITGTLGF